ncbi:MAG TPA: branched-chain amino acid ABC transporter permease [Acidimicrobiales bacterium]|nr:branched-chain amino acid ABC transporter permease [Acidimicrobiales bacterium]
MQLFVEQVINGIANGAIYGALALALVLIFRSTGVLNFAQGEMAMFSTFITWKLTTGGLPVWGAILISMGIAFIAGAAIERTLIRPFEGSNRSPLNVVIVSLGMFLAINSLAQLVFGTDPQRLPSPVPNRRLTILESSNGGINITYPTLMLIAVLIVECIALWWLLQRTKLGLKLRAVAADADSARLHGIKAGSMLMFGWALSAAIGALAGAMVASSRVGFDASLMQTIIVYAFAAAALGGFDSLWGAVLCGIFVGVANSLTVQYVNALDGIELVMPLALILIVLVVMPNGLFGKRTVERV